MRVTEKMNILKGIVFEGYTLEDYRPYNGENSLKVWLYKGYDDESFKHPTSLYYVYIQRPLQDVEEHTYRNLGDLFEWLERDLEYGLNNLGEYDLVT